MGRTQSITFTEFRTAVRDGDIVDNGKQRGLVAIIRSQLWIFNGTTLEPLIQGPLRWSPRTSTKVGRLVLERALESHRSQTWLQRFLKWLLGKTEDITQGAMTLPVRSVLKK
jgi:hypothetical protein